MTAPIVNMLGTATRNSLENSSNDEFACGMLCGALLVILVIGLTQLFFKLLDI